MRSTIRLRAKNLIVATATVGALVALSACVKSESEPITVADVGEPVAWGPATTVRPLRHLWIGNQPDEAGLDAAEGAGVQVVIDLRQPDERDWDEGEAVRARGLTYYNAPVSKDGAFSAEVFSEIENLVRSHEGEQIFLHCSSGNRAAGWLATHLARIHEIPFDEAVAIGRRAGITKEPIVEKVAEYLGEPIPNAER